MLYTFRLKSREHKIIIRAAMASSWVDAKRILKSRSDLNRLMPLQKEIQEQAVDIKVTLLGFLSRFTKENYTVDAFTLQEMESAASSLLNSPSKFSLLRLCKHIFESEQQNLNKLLTGAP